MWANENVRQKYEKRSLREVENVGKRSCEEERKEGGEISIFPAVALDEEVDDKTCINKNRIRAYR